MSRLATIHALTSTGRDGWRTPPEVIRSVSAEFNLTLDLASSYASALPWAPDRFLGPWSTLAVDALTLAGGTIAQLADAGACWLNPPYSVRGGGLRAWHRLARTLAADHGLDVLVLCPPHPGRRWFWESARYARAIRFYRQRIAFLDEYTGEPVRRNTQDSALFWYSRATKRRQPDLSWIDVPKGIAA